MKILNISLDKNILNLDSKSTKRIVEYGDIVDRYVVLAPNKDFKEIKVSEKVFIYGSGGRNKIFKLLNIYKISKKLLKQNKFDIITVQDQYFLALIGFFLSKKFKVGLEVQIHGFEKYYGLRKIIANFIIPKADAIRCVSERLKKRLINEFGVKEENVTVVPIYLENKKRKKDRGLSSAKRPARRRFGAGGSGAEVRPRSCNKFVFLTVGRLVLVKNIGLQIKAMAEVLKEYPNIELWIVGEGDEKEKLKLQALKLELENNIKFFGWQENTEKFYIEADAFLLTSDYEGWGMVVVEAVSYGLPIIMTNVGLAGEFIKNEENGIVIPVNNQAKLQEAMIRIIKDDNLRERFIENGFSAIKNLPNKEETLALYKTSCRKAVK